MKKIEDNLLAILVYGGVSAEKVEIEIPEDETRLEELGMVFENEYGKFDVAMLQKEVEALEKRRREETKKNEIFEMTRKLDEIDDEVEKKKILEKIMALRKS